MLVIFLAPIEAESLLRRAAFFLTKKSDRRKLLFGRGVDDARRKKAVRKKACSGKRE